MSTPHLDEALGPVADRDRILADSLLDLREAALQRRDAGQCLQCYFRIYGRAAERGVGPITPLRQWMESHLEIVARDHEEQELERVPLILESESLEDFCSGMMREFRENRCYPQPAIELSLAFKTVPAA
ncbi:MAG: hypothetical protein GVY10_05685 [Verrucomicrobia bacterium]|nr:hypothetical protein [Verrucomicrobiota bacterium]